MKYVFCIALAIGVCACTPQTQPGNNASGSASGVAKLFDKEGNLLPSGGITVMAIGTQHIAITDDTGYWTIKGLPAGTYSFSFTKNGFGLVKDLSENKSNGKDMIHVEEADLTQPTSELVNFQTFKIISSNTDSVPTYFIQAGVPQPFLDRRSLVLAISTDSSELAADPSSAPIILEFVTDPNAMPTIGYDGGFYWNSTNAQLQHYNFIPHGARIYAALCVSGKGASCEFLSNYYDPSLNKQVYTALGPHAQILSAKMP